MAWFHNYYKCNRCNGAWEDEWSCTCDDDCPCCGARHMTPYKSDDLTQIIVREGRKFVVFRSPDTATYDPDYRALRRFATRHAADTFLDT